MLNSCLRTINKCIIYNEALKTSSVISIYLESIVSVTDVNDHIIHI